jgi:hypothetical protein
MRLRLDQARNASLDFLGRELSKETPNQDEMKDHMVLIGLAEYAVAKHPHTHPDDKRKLWPTCSNAFADAFSVMTDLTDRLKLGVSKIGESLEPIHRDLRDGVSLPSLFCFISLLSFRRSRSSKPKPDATRSWSIIYPRRVPISIA